MSGKTLLPSARDRLVTVSDKAQFTKAAAYLEDGRMSLVDVCDDSGIMLGVVSKTDIISRIGNWKEASCLETAGAVMTRDVACCRPEDSLTNFWSLMKERGFL